MDTFDETDFVIEQQRAILEGFLRHFEQKYFAGVARVAAVEVAAIDGPSKYDPGTKTIYIHEAMARFPKISRVLLLHELIHNKLMRQQVREDRHEKLFQDEVKALWDAGAYAGIL